MATASHPLGRGVLVWSRNQIAAVLVAMAMACGAVVSSEPAPADVIMLGLIFALPILGMCKPGGWAMLQLLIWLVIFACSLVAASFAPDMARAVKHQLITLFLVAGAFVIAGYVAGNPRARAELILFWYTVGVAIACVLAIAGQLKLFPGAFDLFTLYGRGRGTFKDPNVLGAAIVPALAYVTWLAMRQNRLRAGLVMLVGAILVLGLLFSFSRGAWLAALIAVGLVVLIAGASGRRAADRTRLALLIFCGSCALVALLVVALQFEAVRDLLHERASLSQSYDQGPDGRFGGQAKAADVALSSPLGIGAKMFSREHHHEAPHQVYLSMFLASGWLGGLLFLASVILTLAVVYMGGLRPGELQGPMLIVWASFFAMSVEGLVIDSDHWRHYFLLMGLAWGLADAQRPHAGRTRRPR